jgi:hypothetical protein
MKFKIQYPFPLIASIYNTSSDEAFTFLNEKDLGGGPGSYLE